MSNELSQNEKSAIYSRRWHFVGWWVTVVFATALAYGFYDTIGFYADVVAIHFPATAAVKESVSQRISSQVLAVVGGLLIWWRFVKVLAMQGSPFSWFVEMADGAEGPKQTGRKASMVFIGDTGIPIKEYKGEFWFGAVFRPHPRSDKLMRSRLELLLVYLCFGWTLVILDSRFSVYRMSHKNRANLYTSHWNQYTQLD